jgi:sugar O-acyltransferase (sialic acid O-acetyltransferase NeuD family)
MLRACAGRNDLLYGVVDDSPSDTGLSLLQDTGVPYLGSVADLVTDTPECDYLIAIADPHVRATLDAHLMSRGLPPGVFVDPSAAVGTRVPLGPGTIVMSGAQVSVGARTGRHAHVHVNATIGHDTQLGDFASVYPNGSVAGSCRIGKGSTIGANATVIQGLTVGSDSMVGAGSVVTRNVASGLVVKGVPAR